MRRLVLTVLAGVIAACSSGQERDPAGGDLGEAVAIQGEALNLGAITVAVPESWIKQQPRSSMRKAQFALPAQEGDPEDAELVVFYFGTASAGSVGANLARWRGQMKGAEGDTKKSAVNGMAVTTLDVSGSYAAAMGPMMQAGPEKPNYRMIASIVESRAGAYYFKLTGPEKTVEHWQPMFAGFIQTARASG